MTKPAMRSSTIVGATEEGKARRDIPDRVEPFFNDTADFVGRVFPHHVMGKGQRMVKDQQCQVTLQAEIERTESQPFELRDEGSSKQAYWKTQV